MKPVISLFSICVCLFFFFSERTFAQNAKDSQTEEVIIDSTIVKPRFIGGDVMLLKYLQTSLRYPKKAAEKRIEGRVLLRFVVTKTGRIVEPQVIEEVHPLLDAEAIRVISNMPDWIPGSLNGRPVSVYFTMPVVFKLQK